MAAIVDIETNGFKNETTEIHCIVAKCPKTNTIKEWVQEDTKQFGEWSKNIDTFIMHNGLSFDAPILNKFTGSSIKPSQVRDTLIEEYSKYDKDLKLLTFKILLEKFNSKYGTLLPDQKNILKEFITSVDSSARLRNVVNEEFKKLKSILTKLNKTVNDDIVSIKLNEVVKSIKPVSKTKKVTDDHLVDIMQYYELVQELKGL